jgi:CheY-like chemotaxis protein
MQPERQAGKTILVVEDDGMTRGAMKTVLEWEGYRVRCAANGQEALDLLRDGERPSVILLDLIMPVLGGREFRERQMQDPGLADIPVVIISGADGALLDAVGHVRKPFEPKELLAAIWNLA